MTDQECSLQRCLRLAGILTEYLEPGPRNADKTIQELIAGWLRMI
jgi:hypothetical protein